MNVRVIVPLKWDSQLRQDLFIALSKLGYTWSKGYSLMDDQPKMHHMAYVAINCIDPIISFSSQMKIVEKPTSECGFNYMLVKPSVDKVVKTINYIKQYLAENPEESRIQNFVESHYELKDLFILT